MSELQEIPATILVVDDIPQNLNVASRILREYYRCLVALDGYKAIEIASSPATRPDLILLDVMMPKLNGYETCRFLKDDERTRDIPVIFLTAVDEIESEAAGFEAGAVDYITKPIQPATLLARVRTHLRLYQQERHLNDLVRQRTRALVAKTEELEETRLEVIRRLGRAAEYKDDNTGLHVIRMSHYARLLALAAGFTKARADVLFNAAPMHDVGKIGIPDSILQKPDDLTADEWTIMRRHPGIGAGIIGDHDSDLLQMARIVALGHHERWDGSGYPRAQAGEAIPLEARIVAVADVFDALSSTRPYKFAWTVEASLQYIREQAGQHFDPRLSALFMQLAPQVLEIRQQYPEP